MKNLIIYSNWEGKYATSILTLIFSGTCTLRIYDIEICLFWFIINLLSYWCEHNFIVFADTALCICQFCQILYTRLSVFNGQEIWVWETIELANRMYYNGQSRSLSMCAISKYLITTDIWWSLGQNRIL